MSRTDWLVFAVEPTNELGSVFIPTAGGFRAARGQASRPSGGATPDDDVPVEEVSVPTHVEDLLRVASVAAHRDPWQVASRIEVDVAAFEICRPGAEVAVATRTSLGAEARARARPFGDIPVARREGARLPGSRRSPRPRGCPALNRRIMGKPESPSTYRVDGAGPTGTMAVTTMPDTLSRAGPGDIISPARKKKSRNLDSLTTPFPDDIIAGLIPSVTKGRLPPRRMRPGSTTRPAAGAVPAASTRQNPSTIPHEESGAMRTVADPRPIHTTHRAGSQHRGPRKSWGNVSPWIFTPLLLLTASAVAQRKARADITYDFGDAQSYQNKYTISGTITTDGTTGEHLSSSDVRSLTLTITNGSTQIEQFTTETSNIIGSFAATSTQISLSDIAPFQIKATAGDAEILWQPGVYEAFGQTGNLLWGLAWNPPAPIAIVASSAVPEPSSAVLFALGGVAVLAVYRWGLAPRCG